MTDLDVDNEAPEGFDGDAMRTATTDEVGDLLNELGPDARYSDDEAAAEVMRIHQAFVQELAVKYQAATGPQAETTGTTVADETEPDVDASARSNTSAPSTPPAVTAVVIVLAGTTAELTAGAEVVVGRRGNYQLKHPRVSRRHLQVRVTDDEVLCQDLGSANGAWLVRADARTRLEDTEIELRPGDRVVTVDDVELLRWG